MQSDGNDPEVIASAAQALAAGELVAFPTETVYGLGARADSDRAVAAIFAAKGRPMEHPLIVHVRGPDAAAQFAEHIPAVAKRLMTAFWPGPLTLILPRRPGFATTAAGGHASIGLRCPSHGVAQALLSACASLGVPGIAAPSANRFGRISPTLASHVVAEFGAALRVLDGGPCELGIESAIVDCSRAHPMLLRPGVLSRDRIQAAAGEALAAKDEAASPAPGSLGSHYAPDARLRLMPRAALRDALALLGADAAGVAVYSRSSPETLALPAEGRRLHRRMPDQADAAAHELFAVLRELDALGVALIWVEAPPESAAWDGVRDRLQRAAAT